MCPTPVAPADKGLHRGVIPGGCSGKGCHPQDPRRLPSVRDVSLPCFSLKDACGSVCYAF